MQGQLPHQACKGQLADEQGGAALVFADLTQRHGAGPEAVRPLCTQLVEANVSRHPPAVNRQAGHTMPITVKCLHGLQAACRQQWVNGRQRATSTGRSLPAAHLQRRRPWFSAGSASFCRVSCLPPAWAGSADRESSGRSVKFEGRPQRAASSMLATCVIPPVASASFEPSEGLLAARSCPLRPHSCPSSTDSRAC